MERNPVIVEAQKRTTKAILLAQLKAKRITQKEYDKAVAKLEAQ